MSERSIQFHMYEEASKLSRRITEAAIVIKKDQLRPEMTLDPEKLAQGRKFLSDTFTAIAYDLNRSSLGRMPYTQANERVGLPSAVINGLQTRHENDLPFFIDQLGQTTARLHEQTPLDEQDLTLIDELAAVVDAHTSAKFQKLMGRR